MPLGQVYRFMRRSSMVYFIYAAIFIISGITNMAGDQSSGLNEQVGIVYIISGVLAALAGGTSLYCYQERSQCSSILAATFMIIFMIWTMVKFALIFSFLGSYINPVIIAIYIIVGLTLVVSAASTTYIHYKIVMKLRNGEDPHIGTGGGLQSDLIPASVARSDTNVPPPVYAEAVPIPSPASAPLAAANKV